LGGTTEPFNNSGQSFLEGSVVAINANPDTGKAFSKWIINNVEYTEKVLNVIMNNNVTATAYFTGGIVYDLIIDTNGNGSTTPVAGTYQYNSGDGVLITAIPNNGSYFESFDIDGVLSYNNPVQITMNSNKNVTANFNDYLNIQISAYGQGLIVPSGQSFLKENDELLVVALPNFGSYFEKFTVNGVDSVTNPLYLTVTESLTIEGIFKDYIIVNINDAENGLVDPIGTKFLKENDEITLTATPNSGFTFVNYDINGTLYTSNPLTFNVIDDVTIVTNFEIIPLPVYFELNISQVGMGTVTPLGCFDKLENSQTVINASATDNTFEFTHFLINGVINTNTTIIITSTQDVDVVAVFTKIIKWKLDISQVGLGSTSPLGCFIKNNNEQTVITATESNSNYYFLNYTVNGVINTNNPLTITSTEDKIVVANFAAYNNVISTFNSKSKRLSGLSFFRDKFNDNDIYTTNSPSNVFNGTSSAISGTCPLIGQKEIDIEWEMIPTNVSGLRTIISWGGFAANKKGLQIYFSTGTIVMQYSDGNVNGTKGFNTINFASYNYYYCKFSWDGKSTGRPVLNVNGIDYLLSSTIGYSWTGDTGDNGAFKIGSSEASTPLNFFAGAITYMKVTNDNVVNAEYAINYGTTSDQTAIYDISGNNRHATLINSVVATFWNKSYNNLINWQGVYGATIYYYGSIILAIPGDNNFTITNYTRVGYYVNGIFPNTTMTYIIPVNSALNTYIAAGIYTWQQLKDIVTTADLTKIQDNYSITELKIRYK
jgi:hypothetical protein